MTELSMDHNYPEIVSKVILNELLLLPEDIRANICSELSDNIDFDTYAIIYTDAHDQVVDYLEYAASDDLVTFIRRSMFMTGRQLVEHYNEKQSLSALLNASIRTGIDMLIPYVSDDDIKNQRIMTTPLDLNVIFVGLTTELLDRTPKEVFEDDSAGRFD